MNVDGWSIDSTPYCSCELRFRGNSTHSQRCLFLAQPLLGSSFSNLFPNRGIQQLNMVVYDFPGRRDLKQFLIIRCQHDDLAMRPVFVGSIGTITWEQMLEIFTNPDPNYVFNFFLTYMADFPLYVMEGGSRNLVLLNRKKLFPFPKIIFAIE